MSELSDMSAIYHIRVKGTPSDGCMKTFPQFAMASRSNGVTLLSGRIMNQANLNELLRSFSDEGLGLLLIARSGCPCSKDDCPRHGHCPECAAYHGAQGKLSFCFREKSKWEKRCSALISPC